MSLTATDSTGSPSLSLPPEVVLSIFSYLDNNTLKNMRTMNRYLEDIASAFLFQEVTLTTPENPKVYRAFGNICRSGTLGKLVREMKFKPYGSVYRFFSESNGQLRRPSFWTSYALPYIQRFPGLHSLSVHFGEKPPGRASYLLERTTPDSEPETPTDGGHMEAPTRPDVTNRIQLRKVSILDAAPDSVWSRDFEAVVDTRKLHHLKLEFEAAELHAGQIYYPDYLAADKFLESLSISWLTPSVVENVRTLDIGLASPWGWVPFVDWKKIGAFPRLKSLTLRKFTFFHESQVDWIASLGKDSGSNGIEILRLDQCQVQYSSLLYMSEELLQFERKNAEHDYTWTSEEGLVGAKLKSSMDAEPRPVYFCFPMRWHMILQKLQESMPGLRAFEMEPTGDVKVNNGDLTTAMQRSRLLYNFYRKFQHVIVYEHQEPKSRVRLEDDCKARDEAALDQLLEALLTRRRSNESRH